ncbi:hypothetical protein ABIA33_002045 [Streptacidiphilus sp. MAP12-16]|uniref:MarR family transcriptional regulator n=1 Tax=Streptacidiphilus sp. MAP12-16 TaxID=3156300 RepID=UPI003516EC2F
MLGRITLTAVRHVSPPPLPVHIRSAATAPLVQTLSRCPDKQLSGVLQVSGDPGGVLHLMGGEVTAVDTPGAPDAATLLLRSGRVSEVDLAAAFTTAAADGHAGAKLIAKALLGAAELRLVCLMAVLDGAFAVAAGRIDACSLESSGVAHVLSATPGVEPERLMRETERRLRALASRQHPICPYRDRVVPATEAIDRMAGPLGGERREILLRANGRRSSRDIAFLIGRGVYAVTVETSRMVSEGLAVVCRRGADSGGRRPSATPGPDPTLPVGTRRERSGDRLPRRSPGVSAINDVLPLRPAGRIVDIP